ncbi:hypothetical protein ACVN7E_24835 [Escherichia coli]
MIKLIHRMTAEKILEYVDAKVESGRRIDIESLAAELDSHMVRELEPNRKNVWVQCGYSACEITIDDNRLSTEGYC